MYIYIYVVHRGLPCFDPRITSTWKYWVCPQLWRRWEVPYNMERIFYYLTGGRNSWRSAGVSSKDGLIGSQDSGCEIGTLVRFVAFRAMLFSKVWLDGGWFGPCHVLSGPWQQILMLLSRSLMFSHLLVSKLCCGNITLHAADPFPTCAKHCLFASKCIRFVFRPIFFYSLIRNLFQAAENIVFSQVNATFVLLIPFFPIP